MAHCPKEIRDLVTIFRSKLAVLSFFQNTARYDTLNNHVKERDSDSVGPSDVCMCSSDKLRCPAHQHLIMEIEIFSETLEFHSTLSLQIVRDFI
jgi:hypothetical protein